MTRPDLKLLSIGTALVLVGALLFGSVLHAQTITPPQINLLAPGPIGGTTPAAVAATVLTVGTSPNTATVNGVASYNGGNVAAIGGSAGYAYLYAYGLYDTNGTGGLGNLSSNAAGGFIAASTSVYCWDNGVNVLVGGCNVGLSSGGAGVVDVGNGTVGDSSGKLKLTAIIAAGSPPTLTGTCTTGTQIGGNTAGSFVATCTVQTVIATFSTTAPNGWSCNFHDISTPTDVLNQTAKSATSCTASGTTVASDVIVFNAAAY